MRIPSEGERAASIDRTRVRDAEARPPTPITRRAPMKPRGVGGSRERIDAHVSAAGGRMNEALAADCDAHVKLLVGEAHEHQISRSRSRGARPCTPLASWSLRRSRQIGPALRAAKRPARCNRSPRARRRRIVGLTEHGAGAADHRGRRDPPAAVPAARILQSAGRSRSRSARAVSRQRGATGESQCQSRSE